MSWYRRPLFCRLQKSVQTRSGGIHAGIPLGAELALLICCNESRREPVGAQAQAALGAPAHIVHQGNRPLVGVFLVEELVLNCVQVDEIAHARACVPANVVRVDVHFPQKLDHLVLVCEICLGTGC